MLTFNNEKLRSNRIVKKLNSFVNSIWYVALVVLLMVVSSVFAQEFVCFYCYAVLALYVTLFADDCFGFLPMMCCGYMTFSAHNNPMMHADGWLFGTTANKVQFVAICAVIALCLICRLCFELVVVRRQSKAPTLTVSFVVVAVGYLLGGAFSQYYFSTKTLLFALLEAVCLCLTYFYLYYTVDWSKRKVDDCAKVLTVVGCGMVVEVISMYFNQAVIDSLQNGTFSRGMLRCGWGVYNNVGCVMAMLTPAPFYYACTKRNGWLYSLLGCLFAIAICLTQSRGSILFGFIVFAGCVVYTVCYSKGKQRRNNLIVFGAVLAVTVAVCAILFDKVLVVFGSVISAGTSSSGRLEIYKNGLEQFTQAPIFGLGWYASELVDVYIHGGVHGTFLAPRYHNTIVQLLATCGSVGLLAYLYHRYQTLRLLWKNRSPSVVVIFASIASLIGTSLLDCNMFNFGPGLIYGVLLVCAEMLPNISKDKVSEGN